MTNQCTGTIFEYVDGCTKTGPVLQAILEPTHPEHPQEPHQRPGEPPPGPWELLFQEWNQALDQKMYKAVRAAYDRSFILLDADPKPAAENREILYNLTRRTYREHYV